MKKIHLLLLGLTICLFSACHDKLWDAIDDLDVRVARLEELCKEMNTNIVSIQTIVNVVQSGDYITGVTEIKKDGEVIGYTITFGQHDPITIYHGQDGKDGADGKDGQDGQNGSANAPVIGVAQDTDGVYYWTLNGEWLLDDNGNKLPVSGKDGQNGTNGSNGQDGADGKDGQDGEDGKDGANGQDGKDGITPQLKIEDGYWYISYDNGAIWTQLGKATGEDGKDGVDGADGKDGQNGADGKDGQDGDSMFQSVTQDENYVYLTLADGTVIKIAKGNDNSQSNDDFIFTITYDPNGGEGVIKKDTCYYGTTAKIKDCLFIKDGFFFQKWNTNPNGTGASYWSGDPLFLSKNIILYAQWDTKKPQWGMSNGYKWVDLGLSVKWASHNIGALIPEDYGDYFAWGEVYSKDDYTWATYQYGGTAPNTLLKYALNYAHTGSYTDGKAVLDACDDAAKINWEGEWRTPNTSEWNELHSECIWTWTTQNNINGYKITATNGNHIFLPAAGYFNGASHYYADIQGYYWSSNLNESVQLTSYYMYLDANNRIRKDISRGYGLSIRPVCP